MLLGTPALTAVEVARGVVAEQTRELESRRRKVSTSPEAVHRMRVATRRLRAALPLLGAELEVRDQMMKRLRWIARRLGAVRDRDVIIELVEHHLTSLRGAERARLGATIRRLRKERRERLELLAEAFTGNKWRKLLRSLRGFAQRPRLLPDVDPVGPRVMAQADLMAAAVAAHPGMTLARPTSRELHRLRIAFKRLRYVLEVHATLDALAYGTELRLARELQDALGAIHDHDLVLQKMERGKGAFTGPWRRFEQRLTKDRATMLRRFGRLKREWIEQTRPAPAPPAEPLRFANLEPQPVTLRLVSGA